MATSSSTQVRVRLPDGRGWTGTVTGTAAGFAQAVANSTGLIVAYATPTGLGGAWTVEVEVWPTGAIPGGIKEV